MTHLCVIIYDSLINIYLVNGSLSANRRPKPILPQNDGKMSEIKSNLPPEEFAQLSGLKEESFSWKEVSETEITKNGPSKNKIQNKQKLKLDFH